MGMNPPDISWVFAMVIFIICALLVIHIVSRLWKHRGLLRQLNEQHRTIVHSLPMSLGMISTMTIGMVVGAVLSTNISAAYITGLLVGLIVSGSITLPFRDEIAMLDGLVSGSMGGLMGVMIALMTPAAGIYTLVILLTALFMVTWMLMDRRIATHKTDPEESEHTQNPEKENMREAPGIYDKETDLSAYEWQEWIQQQVKSAIENEREVMFTSLKHQTNNTIEHQEQDATNEISNKMAQKQQEIAATQKENQL